jgi:hypothetical protein
MGNGSVGRGVAGALAALAIVGAGLHADARAAKPRPPPGRDPGGIAIAVVGAGMDYTRPDVAARVARDGEGELIGWDATDDDPRPFAAGVGLPPLIEPGTRLVVVRAQSTGPDLTRAFAFLARAPARIVVVTQPPTSAAAAALDTTARSLPHLLFIVPAPGGAPRYTAGNIVTAAAWPPDGRAPSERSTADIIVAPAAALREAPGSPDAPPATDGEAAVGLAGVLVCTPGLLQSARSPQDARERLIATGRRVRGVAVPVIEACPAREPPNR